MSMIKKSITVTSQQDEWIRSQIATGDYASDSEVFRDLIRHAQSREAEIEAIRSALRKAEESGLSDRLPEDIMQDVIRRKRANGTQ